MAPAVFPSFSWPAEEARGKSSVQCRFFFRYRRLVLCCSLPLLDLPAMLEETIAVVGEQAASGSGSGSFSPMAYDNRQRRPSGLRGCKATAPLCFV
jgi:hypothetical protein